MQPILIIRDPETLEYRDIAGFPGYRVGNDGSVWSLWRSRGGKGGQTLGKVWRKRKPWLGRRDGYFLIGINANGKQATTSVHRLVLEAFIGPCPDGMEACHNNGNRADNRSTNLRWDTRKNNHSDKDRHGTAQKGTNHGCAKLTWAEVAEIRSSYATRQFTQRELARRFNMSQTNIRRIVNGRIWKEQANAE